MYGCRDGINDVDDYFHAEHIDSKVTVDSSLSNKELAAVSRAVELWHDATGGKVNIELTIGETLPGQRFVVRRALPGELEPNMLASYFNDNIRIGEGAQGELDGILVHEFGHYLGLGHEDVTSSIMYPCAYGGMPEAPTPDAIADLKAIYQW